MGTQDQYLTRSQHKIYHAIKKSLAENYQPSFADLQNMIGCSNITVQRAIKQLEYLDMIEVIRQPRRKNIYRIPED